MSLAVFEATNQIAVFLSPQIRPPILIQGGASSHLTGKNAWLMLG